MVKQALSVPCVCGQALTFPEGEIKTVCQCGAIWEIGHEGFWGRVVVPIVAKKKLNHYERYMAWRNSNPKQRRKRR